MQGDSAGVATPPADADENSVSVDGSGNVAIDGENGADTEEIIVDAGNQRSGEEVEAVESQIQFALLILIILSVLFVIYARYDDWRNYRR